MRRSPTTLAESSPFERVAGVSDSLDEQIELITSAHAEMLASLFSRNATPAVEDTFDPFPLTAEQARKIAWQAGKDLYYVLGRGDQALAFSMLRGFDDGYEVPSFGIFVDHQHQHEGLGRSLTSWTVEQAWQLGCPAVRLSLYADNIAAKRLYDSLGFRELQRTQVIHNGSSTEKIVMRLERSANE
jgi:GNAT superfamily N-acetyltransferase